MHAQLAVGETGLVRLEPLRVGDRSIGWRAEVPSDMLDEHGQVLDDLIAVAFDVLGAQHLNVRVVIAEEFYVAVRSSA